MLLPFFWLAALFTFSLIVILSPFHAAAVVSCLGHLPTKVTFIDYRFSTYLSHCSVDILLKENSFLDGLYLNLCNVFESTFRTSRSTTGFRKGRTGASWCWACRCTDKASVSLTSRRTTSTPPPTGEARRERRPKLEASLRFMRY